MGDSQCIEMDDVEFEVLDECEGEDDDVVAEEEEDRNEESKNEHDTEDVIYEGENDNQAVLVEEGEGEGNLAEKEGEYEYVDEECEEIHEEEKDVTESNQLDSEKNEESSKSVDKDVEILEITEKSNENNADDNQDVMENEDNSVISLDIHESEKMEKSTKTNSSIEQTNTVNFTSDAPSEHLNDSDIIESLEDIQNISLDPTNFEPEGSEINKTSNVCSQENDEQTDSSVNESKSTVESSDVVVLDDSSKIKESIPKGPEWYEEKLNSKIITAKERLTKLSRVLKRSYGCYQECLDRVEAAVGTPVCKLFPPRRCPLNEPYINRWRFVCTKKPIEEPAKAKMEEDNVDMTVDKKVETVWRLEPSEGLTRNANNDFQKIPTFVMRVVKTFEDYINTIEPIEVPDSPQKEAKEPEKCNSDVMEDVIEILEKETEVEKEFAETLEPEQWLWLLVRSNSKNELMLFATGKSVTESSMEKLKHFFENGNGADCNVKSLYCKSLTKVDNVTSVNTTFLLGTEALDETIGGLRIQLAPKTNFWLSTVGAEQLAKEVEMMIVPNPNTVVVDIGCGLGLIGLMMAPKCEKVIGLDSPSEVEEAEMTCELNKITNASFLVGNPSELMTSLSSALVNKRSSVIINANAELGRNIDIITGLRKIPSLRRVVMITTLTKQSVHSILKLIQPTDSVLGDPFVPIRAIVVDTLPIGPQFEVVIRMDRRPMHRILNMHLSKPPVKVKNQNAQNVKDNSSNIALIKNKQGGKKLTPSQRLANFKNRREANKKSSPIKNIPPTNNPSQKGRVEKGRGPGKKLVKNPFYDKPPKPWEKNKLGNKGAIKKQPESPKSASVRANDRRNRKFASLPEQKDASKRKRPWESGNFGSSNSNKKLRNDYDDDLRYRLSNSRIEPPDLIYQMEKQQKLLEVAKQKLSGTRAAVDSSTAKQLQNMLKIAIENSNRVQSHLRRSVWDRIAPHERDYTQQEFDNNPVFKGHYVKELGQEDIIITAPNNEFIPPKEQSRYSGVPPVEPNQLAPKEKWIVLPSDRRDNLHHSQREQDELRSREESNKSRWASHNSSRKSSLASPPRHYDELSASRKSMNSPSNRPLSPPREKPHLQQSRQYDIDSRSPINQRRYSPPRRAPSPRQRQRSPLRLRAPSPIRHLSPPRRQPSPARLMGDDWDIPSRGAVEQHPNWQRSIDRQQNIRQEPPPLMQLRPNIDNNWKGNNPNDSWKASGTSDSWKNNQKMPENRFGNQSGDNWNIRSMETNPGRNDSWVDKQRWELPINKGMWNPGGDRDKEEWNDLPEDARDPWGDDGGIGNLGASDRWKFDNLQQSSSNNWKRDQPPEWLDSQDNWQNQSLGMMNNKSWQGNMGSNQNMINRWNMPNESAQQLPGNWQQGNSWRQNPVQNSTGVQGRQDPVPFGRLRYFNCTLK